MRCALGSLRAIYHSADAIVQIPKRREVGVKEFQDLARLTRGQVVTLMGQLERQNESLEKWKFGRLVPSVAIEANDLDVKKLAGQPDDGVQK
jgi:hypothetical protein